MESVISLLIIEFVNKLTDGLTKNDHFRDMLLTAAKRGFSPKFILFGSWHASLDNLKMIRSLGWLWLTRLASSRFILKDMAWSKHSRKSTQKMTLNTGRPMISR
jgi:hypothetical protein